MFEVENIDIKEEPVSHVYSNEYFIIYILHSICFIECMFAVLTAILLSASLYVSKRGAY